LIDWDASSAESQDERRSAHGRDLKNTGKGNLFVIFGSPTSPS